MNKTIAATLALSAFVLFTAASSTHKTTAASDDPSKPVIVMIGEDMRFTPAKVVIHRGQTVAWQNTSHQIHNVVDVPAQSPKPGIMSVPKGAATFDSGLINYGQTFVQTFQTPGTYKYACTLHIPNGMVGEVIVK